MIRILNAVEEAKPKNSVIILRLYWCIFLSLTVFLAVMVKFPLRIGVGQLLNSFLFYGAISVGCIRAAVWIYRRFGKNSRRLLAVILLSSVLSGWQVFDLFILRTGTTIAVGFGPQMSPSFTEYDGEAWYHLRFPNKDILCNTVKERYFGNEEIAITVQINRNATWFACGG